MFPLPDKFKPYFTHVLCRPTYTHVCTHRPWSFYYYVIHQHCIIFLSLCIFMRIFPTHIVTQKKNLEVKSLLDEETSEFIVSVIFLYLCTPYVLFALYVSCAECRPVCYLYICTYVTCPLFYFMLIFCMLHFCGEIVCGIKSQHIATGGGKWTGGWAKKWETGMLGMYTIFGISLLRFYIATPPTRLCMSGSILCSSFLWCI